MADINLTAAEVAQLILSIGNAAALSTKDKTSLVAAINETLATAEAGGSPKAEKVSYSGNIDGTTVANVKAALDALTAREQALVVRFTKQSSGTITADKTIAAILAAHSSGKPVTGIYANGDYQLLEAQGSVAYFASWTGVDTFMLKGAASAGVDSWTLERLDIKGTNVALKGNIDGEDFTTVAGAIAILNRRGADHVAYSGTIGETTVANVKAALDALAVGNPLDMTADFVASGKYVISDWAVEAAAGSTTEYRIAPGIYQIRDTDGNMIVTIVDDPTGKRLVKQEQITADGVYYLYIGTAMAPGSYSETIYFGADDGPVYINGRTATLPWYNTSDTGKVPVVEGNLVEWKNLIPQIEITLSSGASPAITSVTKDGVSVGNTVAEWANAVYEAVQKNWPIAFVLDNTYYRPSDVRWRDTSTMLQYLYFSGPSDISQFFQIRVWLYTDGRVPEITIVDEL